MFLVLTSYAKKRKKVHFENIDITLSCVSPTDVDDVQISGIVNNFEPLMEGLTVTIQIQSKINSNRTRTITAVITSGGTFSITADLTSWPDKYVLISAITTERVTNTLSNTVEVELIRPFGTSLVKITCANSNQALDDGWMLCLNGEDLAYYDGGSSTVLVYEAYLNNNATYKLTARYVTEQSDNYFELYVDVNGVRVMNRNSGYLDGKPGDIINFGSFTI